MEPFYIRQTADVSLGDKAREWFDMCAAEAKAEGATQCRFSHHPGPILLVECWNIPPRDIGDQGEYRLSVTWTEDTERTASGSKNKPETPTQ